MAILLNLVKYDDTFETAPSNPRANLHITFTPTARIRLNCLEPSSIKGALYRIWCGVNRLGDSGVKVV